MLPDFATMIGAKLVSAGDAEASSGVAWHHKTDGAFHSHRLFRSHSSALTDVLATRGIGRGGSLAAGHVGIELLLDGLMLGGDYSSGETLYLEALTALGPLADGVELTSRRPSGSIADPNDRLRELGEFLSGRGLPHGYRDPETVADRLLRVLSGRPRLRIERHQRDVLAISLAEATETLALDAETLLTELRETLTANTGADGDVESPPVPSSP